MQFQTREELLENTIAALVKKLDGHVILSMEELEDAGDIEIRSLFETHEVELRTSKPENKSFSGWIENHESWN